VEVEQEAMEQLDLDFMHLNEKKLRRF